MPKVYIINRGCHDYSAAEKYGKLVYLTDGLYNRFSTGQIYREFKERMRNSNAEDFILISGLTTMAAIACSMFSIKHGRLNMLIYNNNKSRRDNYVKRTIIMKGGDKNERIP